MRRRQLVELEDLAWCPSAVRDGGTDWLGFVANAMGVFTAVAPKVRAAMAATGTDRIIDLCSGGGGPWLSLAPELAKSGPAAVVLSDLYPNRAALAALVGRSGGRLTVHPEPVDATDVPLELDGVRTIFNAFHHFPPNRARAILADAVGKRRAIVIVEPASHRGIALASMPLQLPAILLLTPFVRPVRLSRFLLTYLLPLIPVLVLWDGTVSMLRLYLEDELRELVESVPGHETFDWDIGRVPVGSWTRQGPMYAVGTPR